MNEIQQLHLRQEERERDQIQSGRDRFLGRLRKAQQAGRASDEGALMVWMVQNLDTLRLGFDEVLNRTGKGRRPALYGMLEDLGSDTVAAVSLMVVANGCLSGTPKDTMGREIVNRLIAEQRAKTMKREAPGLFAYKERSFKGNADFWFRAKSLWASLKWAEGIDHSKLEYTMVYRTTLSTQILQVIQGVIGEVLEESKKWRGKKSTIYWGFTPAFRAEITAKDAEFALLAKPVYRPLLVPPRDWSAEDRGGYWYGLRGDVTPIRYGRKWQRNALEDGRDLSTFYKALNTIQSTPWKINVRVLEAMNHIQARGGDPKVGIPFMDPAPAPKWPSVVPFPSRGPHAKLTQNERNLIESAENKDEILAAMAEYKQARNEWHQQEQERTSVARAYLNMIDVAWENETEERIYFAFNVDWRGRVYPATEYLHPQSEDTSRGLLQFAEGHALGETGHYWLAVRGATSWDGDEKLSKQSFDRRFEWVNNNAHQITAIAIDPYGNDSWREADEPWQFLAFCFEWTDYLNGGQSPEFVSYLPVPMDGASNAYQHYAALWRDAEGAGKVNMTDSDKPTDLYQEVADRALEIMQERFESTGDQLAGLWLGSGILDRKLAKIPTMTAVYGSRVQMWPRTLDKEIRGKLTDEEYESVKAHFAPASEEGKQNGWWLARALVSEVLHEAMCEIMPAAMNGRDYFRAVAKAMADEDKTVEWTTPVVNFPVRQASFHTTLKQVNTLLNGSQCYRQAYPSGTSRLDKVAQQDGIAANFVHSHDAAHLMATVAELADQHGVTSVMTVHDSFAVHACNVPIMRQVLANTFIAVHSEPVLANLRASVEADIEDPASLPDQPEEGTFDLGQVRAATYLFS